MGEFLFWWNDVAHQVSDKGLIFQWVYRCPSFCQSVRARIDSFVIDPYQTFLAGVGIGAAVTNR